MKNDMLAKKFGIDYEEVARQNGLRNSVLAEKAFNEAVKSAMRATGNRDFETLLMEDKDYFLDVFLEMIMNYAYKESTNTMEVKTKKAVEVLEEYVKGGIGFNEMLGQYEIPEEDAYGSNIMVTTDKAILPDPTVSEEEDDFGTGFDDNDADYTMDDEYPLTPDMAVEEDSYGMTSPDPLPMGYDEMKSKYEAMKSKYEAIMPKHEAVSGADLSGDPNIDPEVGIDPSDRENTYAVADEENKVEESSLNEKWAIPSDRLESLSDSLSTSKEVLLAIADITSNEKELMSVWDSPSSSEDKTVVKLAKEYQKLAGNEGEDLFWGIEKI